MEKNSFGFMAIEYPDAEEKERQILQILAQSVPRPQKMGSALWNLWSAVGFWGICFGVWDCILLALLLDGVLWAAVYETVKHSPQMIGLLVFLVSPVLYAVLHVLTVWKERMAGMYQTLMVCRMTVRQMTVLRLLLSAGVSILLLGGIHLWAVVYAERGLSALRMLCLSALALFFYAWMQMLLEWKWRHRMAYGAAPVLWSGCSMVLLLLDAHDVRILEGIPTTALLLSAAVCAGMYFMILKKYYFEPCETV